MNFKDTHNFTTENTNLFNDVREVGIAQQQPPPRSNTVGLVLEFRWRVLVEVTEPKSQKKIRYITYHHKSFGKTKNLKKKKNLQSSFQNFGVNPGYTVDGVASDDGQMSHVDSLLALLLDEGHATQAVKVTRELGLDILQMQEVDVVDDLEVTRQNSVEHVRGPSLQGLRQYGVVSVGAGANCYFPSLNKNS